MLPMIFSIKPYSNSMDLENGVGYWIMPAKMGKRYIKKKPKQRAKRYAVKAEKISIFI